MNAELLKETRQVLVELRVVIHDDVDTGVINLIDTAIADLDTCINQDTNRLTAMEILSMLGRIVELLPVITQLFNQFSE